VVQRGYAARLISARSTAAPLRQRDLAVLSQHHPVAEVGAAPVSYRGSRPLISALGRAETFSSGGLAFGVFLAFMRLGIELRIAVSQGASLLTIPLLSLDFQ
jgi:hypothetical protein